MPRRSNAAPHAAATPIVDLVDRLATEFGALADLARFVQDMTGRIDRSGFDEAAIMAAQRLDEMTQRLDGLAIFALALGSVIPVEWRVDAGPATALLTLSDLQRRLSGVNHLPMADAAAKDDFEMF